MQRQTSSRETAWNSAPACVPLLLHVGSAAIWLLPLLLLLVCLCLDAAEEVKHTKAASRQAKLRGIELAGGQCIAEEA